MTRHLILIGIISTILLVIILIKKVNNKKFKYIVLTSPFVLAGILYSSIFLLTKDMTPDMCDGAALLGILFSFILIGIGILLNLTNMLYLLINHKLGNKG